MSRRKIAKDEAKRMKRINDEYQLEKERRREFAGTVRDKGILFVDEFANDMGKQGKLFRIDEVQKQHLVNVYTGVMGGSGLRYSYLGDIMNNIKSAIRQGSTYVSIRIKPRIQDKNLEYFKFIAFIIKIIKSVTSLVNDMKFDIKKNDINHDVEISWDHIVIKRDDVVRCRNRIMRKQIM